MSVALKPAKELDKSTFYQLHVELFRNHIERIWGWDEQWQKDNFHKEWEDSLTERIQSGGDLLGCVQTIKKIGSPLHS